MNDDVQVGDDILTSSNNDDARHVREELEAEICLPLRIPVLRGGPCLHHSRTPVSIGSLRRSGRLVAKPRAANTTRQAQLVLSKKLGIAIKETAVDADIESKFKAAFRGDISEKKQAM